MKYVLRDDLVETGVKSVSIVGRWPIVDEKWGIAVAITAVKYGTYWQARWYSSGPLPLDYEVHDEVLIKLSADHIQGKLLSQWTAREIFGNFVANWGEYVGR